MYVYILRKKIRCMMKNRIKMTSYEIVEWLDVAKLGLDKTEEKNLMHPSATSLKQN